MESKNENIFRRRINNNTTLKTFHTEMAQHFDAISPVLQNTSNTNSPFLLAKISVASEWGDGNNSAGTWVTVTNDTGDTRVAFKNQQGQAHSVQHTVNQAYSIAFNSQNRYFWR